VYKRQHLTRRFYVRQVEKPCMPLRCWWSAHGFGKAEVQVQFLVEAPLRWCKRTPVQQYRRTEKRKVAVLCLRGVEVTYQLAMLVSRVQVPPQTPRFAVAKVTAVIRWHKRVIVPNSGP
jgi:hypothetical protein